MAATTFIFVILILAGSAHLLPTSKACAHKDPLGKAMLGSALRMQAAHHFEKGYFLTSVDEFNENDVVGINSILKESIDQNNFSSFASWTLAVDGSSDYVTMSLWFEGKDKDASLGYVGAASYNLNLVNTGARAYKFFCCTGPSLQSLPFPTPLRKRDGTWTFRCPEGSKEDC